jgi:hypothetical protein
VFITAVPIIKLFAWGEGDCGGHVLRETTSRGACGLVCPSRTSERGGEGDCVCLLLQYLFITAVPITKLFADMKKDTGLGSSSHSTHHHYPPPPREQLYRYCSMCVFITAVPIIKLFEWGKGECAGHVLRETTSRGACGLVCPSRTSERGGEGDCVKEGGGGEEERESERALGLPLCHSPGH